MILRFEVEFIECVYTSEGLRCEVRVSKTTFEIEFQRHSPLPRSPLSIAVLFHGLTCILTLGVRVRFRACEREFGPEFRLWFRGSRVRVLSLNLDIRFEFLSFEVRFRFSPALVACTPGYPCGRPWASRTLRALRISFPPPPSPPPPHAAMPTEREGESERERERENEKKRGGKGGRGGGTKIDISLEKGNSHRLLRARYTRVRVYRCVVFGCDFTKLLPKKSVSCRVGPIEGAITQPFGKMRHMFTCKKQINSKRPTRTARLVSTSVYDVAQASTKWSLTAVHTHTPVIKLDQTIYNM